MDQLLRRSVARHARRHHGIVTREQLLAFGATSRAVDWGVGNGDLTVLLPGVYRVAGAPDSWRGRALAAVWRVDRQARRRLRHDATDPVVALAGPAAAHLHGLPGYGRAPELVVVASRRVRSKDLRVVHRAALTTADVEEVDRIPVVGLAWTAVDLAADGARRSDSDLLAHVLGTGRCRPGQLLGPAHRTIELPGRTRVVEAVRAMSGRPVDHDRSRTEAVVADACAVAGLPRPSRNRSVTTTGGVTYELDLAWLPQRLDVEVDGPHHLLPEQRRRDRGRDRDLRTDDWDVIRIPVEEVDEDLGGVVRRIGLALDGRPSAPPCAVPPTLVVGGTAD